MGGGCFLAFPAASVVSLNAAEGNFWVMSRHRAFAGQLCQLFVLWQPKGISHPVWLLCPTARVTVLMPEWQTGTCAHAEVFLGQSSASEFQTTCMQEIIATAEAGPWVPGPLIPQPPSYTLGWKLLCKGYIFLLTQLVSRGSCVQEVIFVLWFFS